MDASDIGRIRTIRVLSELYERLADRASSNPAGSSSFEHLMNKSVNPAIYDGGQAPPIAPPNPYNQMGSGARNEPIFARPQLPPTPQESRSPEQMPSLLGQAPPIPISPVSPPTSEKKRSKHKFYIPYFGRTSSVASNDSNASVPSSTRSESIGPSSSRHPSFAANPSPLSTPSSQSSSNQPNGKRESNPWASTENTPVVHQKPEKQLSMQPAPSIPSITPSKWPSPENNYSGFCKGAYKLQVGFKDGLKLHNQSISMGGQNFVHICGSTKCAYQGPALKRNNKFVISDSVRDLPGIRWRWSFFAKSHVAMARAKKGIHDYQCIFCVLQGRGSELFHHMRELIDHVLQHRGEHLNEAILQHAKCINDRRARSSENFDVNLIPYEADTAPPSFIPPPSRQTTLSPSRQTTLVEAQLTNSPSSARGSIAGWSNSDDAMSVIDPWKDLE